MADCRHAVLGCVKTHDSQAQPDPRWQDDRSESTQRADEQEHDEEIRAEELCGERESPTLKAERRLY